MRNITTKIDDEERIQPSDPLLAWDYYTDLEHEFIQYSKSVPLRKEHYNVWSPPLGNLLNNTGSIIDSFLKNMFNSGTYCAVFVGDDPKNPRKNNMSTYRNCFEGIHRLSDKTIYELSSFTPITPFSNWKSNKSPEWWTCYTAIKHNRFKNQEKATLKTVLDALGALFLLNAIVPDTKKVLIKNGCVHSHNNTSDLANIIRLLKTDEPLKTGELIYVKTDLFGYVYENESIKLVEDAKRQILSPWLSGYYG